MLINQITYKNNVGTVKRPGIIQIETSMDDPGSNAGYQSYDEVTTSDLDDDIGDNLDILV